jgi:MFS family permease
MVGVVGLMTITAFVSVAASTTMPVIARDLGGLDSYVWAYSAFATASLAGIVVAGVLCDAKGPTAGLALGVTAICVGSIACATAQIFPWLVTGRVFQGLGGGALMVSSYVVVARAVPDLLRPKAMAALAAAWVVPMFAGAVIAGWMTDAISWRAVFWAVPAVAIPLAILITPRLRSLGGSGDVRGVTARLIAATVAVCGLLLIQAGLIQVSVEGIAMGLIGATVVVIASRGLLPRGSLTLRPGLPTTVLMRGVIASGFFASIAFLPLALIELRGATATEAGLVMGISGFAWWIGSFTQGRLATPENNTRVIAVGASIVTLALLLMPLIVLTSLPIWTAAVFVGIAEIGLGLALPAVGVQTFRQSSVDRQGFNSSALQVVDIVLGVVAAACLSVIYSWGLTNPHNLSIAMAAIWCAGAITPAAGVILSRRMKRSSGAEATAI